MKRSYLISSALAPGLVSAYLVSPAGTAAPGASEDCSAWIRDTYQLSCDTVVAYMGITLEQFVEWNPLTNATDDGCSMIKGLYYCVQVNYSSATTASSSTSSLASISSAATVTTTPPTSLATTATTTSSGNGITTPTPTQTGMVSSCEDFYLVVSGDSCWAIANDAGIDLDDFYEWNPAVGSDCSSLWPDYYVCVGIGGSAATPSTTTVSPTPTSGNGITTPTPTQTGMVSSCDDFYLVVSGDGCWAIANDAGIDLDDFYEWNPAVGSDCSSLWPDYYVCIGITS